MTNFIEPQILFLEKFKYKLYLLFTAANNLMPWGTETMCATLSLQITWSCQSIRTYLDTRLIYWSFWQMMSFQPLHDPLQVCQQFADGRSMELLIGHNIKPEGMGLKAIDMGGSCWEVMSQCRDSDIVKWHCLMCQMLRHHHSGHQRPIMKLLDSP